MNIQPIEKELWEAAGQLRANSRLTAAEYSMPVLGLIFLRHTDNRYRVVLEQVVLERLPQRDGKPLRSRARRILSARRLSFCRRRRPAARLL